MLEDYAINQTVPVGNRGYTLRQLQVSVQHCISTRLDAIISILTRNLNCRQVCRETDFAAIERVEKKDVGITCDRHAYVGKQDGSELLNRFRSLFQTVEYR